MEDGFYYDFDRDEPFTPEDLASIEERMAQIATQALPFVREEVSRQQAIARFQDMGETYKVELLEELDTDTVSLSPQGSFTDLCRGPHLPDTSWLQSLSSCAWPGPIAGTIL